MSYKVKFGFLEIEVASFEELDVLVSRYGRPGGEKQLGGRESEVATIASLYKSMQRGITSRLEMGRHLMQVQARLAGGWASLLAGAGVNERTARRLIGEAHQSKPPRSSAPRVARSRAGRPQRPFNHFQVRQALIGRSLREAADLLRVPQSTLIKYVTNNETAIFADLRIDWDTQPLGKTTDIKLAKTLGVTQRMVTREREVRAIEIYSDRWGGPR